MEKPKLHNKERGISEFKETGLLNQKQFKVLKLRFKGMTQLEAAKARKTTRANVSMIEWRARRKIERARETNYCVRFSSF